MLRICAHGTGGEFESREKLESALANTTGFVTSVQPEDGPCMRFPELERRFASVLPSSNPRESRDDLHRSSRFQAGPVVGKRSTSVVALA
jgi:hypothetical protein